MLFNHILYHADEKCIEISINMVQCHLSASIWASYTSMIKDITTWYGITPKDIHPKMYKEIQV